MVDDVGASSSNAGVAQGLQGVVFGQQQIPPALGNLVFIRQGELHNLMPIAKGGLRKGREFWLFASG